MPVGSVISLHRLDVLTSSPASLWCSGRALLTWSENPRYGSPVSNRAVRIRTHSARAEIDRTTDLSFGDSSDHCSSASTARMNASGIWMPWCRFSAFRFGSPPVGRRISMNSSISGCHTGKYTAADPRRSDPWEIAKVNESITRMNGITPDVLPTAPTFSPIERRLPQYDPMPPPFDASHTFTFHSPTIPSRLSDASLRKQEIGRPRWGPPFDSTGGGGMKPRFDM